jgi:hypothetical protein
MRVFSLGLLIAAPLGLFGWHPFLDWIVGTAPHYEIPLPTGVAVSAITIDEAGAGIMLPSVFIMLCLGVGFTVSEFLWGVLAAIWSAPAVVAQGVRLASRRDEGDSVGRGIARAP